MAPRPSRDIRDASGTARPDTGRVEAGCARAGSGGRNKGRRRGALVAGIVATGLLASGCSGARKALGFEKTTPDEFAVMPRAPLTMPPDFALRPPSADASGPKETTPAEIAKQTVFRAAGDVPDPTIQTGTASSGERSLLASANAANPDPQIRRQVTEDAAQIYPTGPSLTERLIFWRKPELPGEVVNASQESRRLKENLALNKPATEGDTPSIKRRSKALFEGIF